MTPLERILANSHVERYDFEAVNIPDAAGTAVALGGGAGGSDYPLPKSGYILMIASRLNAALVGGSIVFRPLINGSAVTGAANNANTSTAQQNKKEFTPEQWKFAANSYLGCDWTKSGTVNPTTLDAVISIWVVFDDMPAA